MPRADRGRSLAGRLRAEGVRAHRGALPWPPDCTTYGEYFRTLPEDVREAAVSDWRNAGLS
ncbi:hypothetical protein N7U49_35430 [Streptomyces sp. AD2-2]|nr:hypothetical protein N7U49_35430 [Streptomyces sp. AD2-2]